MALAFYRAHRAEMEAGAVTSWAARGVLELMTIRARDGHAAFDSEYQNDPVSGDAAPFAKPTLLLVPTTMGDLANSIIKPEKYENGKYNPHHNKVQVIATPWLL